LRKIIGNHIKITKRVILAKNSPKNFDLEISVPQKLTMNSKNFTNLEVNHIIKKKQLKPTTNPHSKAKSTHLLIPTKMKNSSKNLNNQIKQENNIQIHENNYK